MPYGTFTLGLTYTYIKCIYASWVLFGFLEIRSYYVALAGLRLLIDLAGLDFKVILLPLSLEC